MAFRRLIAWVKSLFRTDVYYDEMEDVRKFHRKFDMMVHSEPTHLTGRKLAERVVCMREEVQEFEDAARDQDMAKMFDALIDLVYFAKGTAVQMGLPWDEGWEEVQRANMEKVRGVGPRGQKVDCVKPPGWVPPQIGLVLEMAGYKRWDWHRGGQFMEYRAKDDAEQVEEVA